MRSDTEPPGSPSEPALDYTGKVVLVTGGTKGIGRTIVQRYLDWGASVATCGRNEPADLPEGVDFRTADVRDPEAADALVDSVIDAHGRIDVVVNNAGGAPEADAATASPRFSESIIRLNLLAPLHVSQRANHHMQSQAGSEAGAPRGGVIINVASVSATRPSPGTAAYGAAKAGLLNLTGSLAVEWAPRVRVVAIVAGLILTEGAELHYGDEESVARVAATVPAGRMGTPEDIAQACRWLGSDLASYVSGSAIWLHGGGERPAFLDAVQADGQV